jgi:hypothetical protein
MQRSLYELFNNVRELLLNRMHSLVATVPRVLSRQHDKAPNIERFAYSMHTTLNNLSLRSFDPVEPRLGDE